MSSLMSSIINGVASVGNNVINAITQGSINAVNRKYDSKVRAQEHQRALQRQAQAGQIARENFDHEFSTEAQYNNPMAERERLERAGLNTSLMYGAGAGGSSVSASVGSTPVSSPAPGPGAIAKAPQLDVGSSLVRVAQLRNETKVAEAQKNKLDAEAEEIRSRIPDSTPVADGEKPSFAQLQYLLSNNKYVREVYGSEFDKVKLDVAKATAQAEIQTAFVTLDSIVSRIENDKNVSSALAEKYRAEVNDMKSTLPSRVASNEANAREANVRSAQLEFDNKMQQTIGYRPGWNVWQMLAGVYQKAVFVLDYQDHVDNVSDDVEKSVKTWFDKLNPEEQKIIKENLKNFIWQLK